MLSMHRMKMKTRAISANEIRSLYQYKTNSSMLLPLKITESVYILTGFADVFKGKYIKAGTVIDLL